MNKKDIRVKSVVYGKYSIECLLDENNGIWIAQPTIEKLFGWRVYSFSEKASSKSLKAFVHKDFRIKKKRLSGTFHDNAATNFINFDSFIVLLKWQVKEKNENAIDLVIAGFADSLLDFIYNDFAVEFSREVRNKLLELRQEGIELRHELTAAIHAWLKTISPDSAHHKFIYSNVSDAINRGVFNRSAKQLQKDWNVKVIRDAMNKKELRYVAQVQDVAAQLITSENYKPMDAVAQAIAWLKIPVQTR